MNAKQEPVLLLALGNDIIGDDGVALSAARILRDEFGEEVDIEESTEGGLALLDIMAGYRRVLILDSIITGSHPPGTVLEFTRNDFDKVTGPSPHYAGLPEVIALSERLQIEFPEEIHVVALEIENPERFSERLNPVIEQALPRFVEKTAQRLRHWKKSKPETSSVPNHWME